MPQHYLEWTSELSIFISFLFDVSHKSTLFTLNLNTARLLIGKGPSRYKLCTLGERVGVCYDSERLQSGFHQMRTHIFQVKPRCRASSSTLDSTQSVDIAPSSLSERQRNFVNYFWKLVLCTKINLNKKWLLSISFRKCLPKLGTVN